MSNEKGGYEVLPNSIMLFENDKKSKDTHPDYTGKMYDKDGVEHYVSCWMKTSKKGSEYLSGSIINADEAKNKYGKKSDGKNEKLPESKPVLDSGDSNIDDDLPF